LILGNHFDGLTALVDASAAFVLEHHEGFDVASQKEPVPLKPEVQHRSFAKVGIWNAKRMSI
jgi:hypothetical protein